MNDFDIGFAGRQLHLTFDPSYRVAEIGDALRENVARVASRVGQKRFAAMLGIHKGHLSSALSPTGRHSCSEDMIALAVLLDDTTGVLDSLAHPVDRIVQERNPMTDTEWRRRVEAELKRNPLMLDLLVKRAGIKV